VTDTDPAVAGSVLPSVAKLAVYAVAVEVKLVHVIVPAVALVGKTDVIITPYPVALAPRITIPGIRIPVSPVYGWDVVGPTAVSVKEAERAAIVPDEVSDVDTVTALDSWRVGQKPPPEWCW
jgi:hypothetical protein